MFPWNKGTYESDQLFFLQVRKSGRIMKHFRITDKPTHLPSQHFQAMKWTSNVITFVLWAFSSVITLIWSEMKVDCRVEWRLKIPSEISSRKEGLTACGLITCDWVATRMCHVCGYAEILQIDQIFSSLTMRQLTSVMYQQRRNTIQLVRRKNVIHCNKHHQHIQLTNNYRASRQSLLIKSSFSSQTASLESHTWLFAIDRLVI